MFKEIEQLAHEKFAGDQELIDAYLAGFVKEAFDIAEFDKGVSSSVGKGVGGTLIGLGMTGFGKALNNLNRSGLHNQFMQSLEHAVATNPVLKQANKEKVVNFANTIFKFSPHVATDANLLSSVLANAIHGESMDPQTLRTLSDLEARYIENHSATSFSPKTYV